MLILKRLSDGLMIPDDDQTCPVNRQSFGDGRYRNHALPDMDEEFDPDNASYDDGPWDSDSEEDSDWDDDENERSDSGEDA